MEPLNEQIQFAVILQNYFYQWLINQRNASSRTVTSYRDTFRLLLGFAEQQLNMSAVQLSLFDLDAPLIVRFLDDLEKNRHNAIRSRNARLAAIRSFFHYAASQAPQALPVIQRVLTIPMKRFERPLVGFLYREEIYAILDAPDPNTWSGQRDRTMFATLYNTGARVSELTSLRRTDVELNPKTTIHLHGKGRKDRAIPLWKTTAAQIRRWLPNIGPAAQDPLFPNRFGRAMTRTGVENRLTAAVRESTKRCPSLAGKRVSPHIVRHTTALHLLQSGVDLSVIALWLGHESITTTHHYLEADLEMKQRALNAIEEPKTTTVHYRPAKDVLSFLDSL